MTIHPIASGSSGNAYLLKSQGRSLLIECGLPIKALRKALRQQSITISDLDACLVSHEHMDHAKSVSNLLTIGIRCMMTPGTARALSIANGYPVDQDASQSYANHWRIVHFPVVHDANDPCGFLIGAGTDVLLYITDAYYTVHKFSGLTHIMVECNYADEILQANESLHPTVAARVRTSHMSLEKVQELLSANDLTDVREIWLLHLSDANSNAELFIDTIQKQTGIPVWTA